MSPPPTAYRPSSMNVSPRGRRNWRYGKRPVTKGKRTRVGHAPSGCAFGTRRTYTDRGWREFLAAEGVSDRAVLHGGATAVFRVQSLLAAVRVADSIANVPGIAGAGMLLSLADERVAIRLTRDLWALESKHIALARAISAAAR